MTYQIHIQNEHGYDIEQERLRRACRAVLAQEGSPANSALTIVITGNKAVRTLNKLHRGVDSTTDVLSFPAPPLPPMLAEAEDEYYVGDIIIAYDYALSQAHKLAHDFMDNLCLLVVHGTLHVLGYDHDTPANRASMWAAQAQALHSLGISEDLVPGLENAAHD